MLDSKLVYKLTKLYCTPELYEKLPDVIAEASHIKLLIDNINNKIYLEEERHKKLIDKLIDDKSKIRDDCKHFSVTYHSDPSGGNDSYHECDICGY